MLFTRTRERAEVEFLRAQVRTLLGVIGNKRILLTDEQRRLLATTGIAARDSLAESSLIFKPETILKWHRALKAAKWDFSKRRKAGTGRPPTAADTEAVIVKPARDNVWGHDRIVGEMAKLGHTVSPTTVRSSEGVEIVKTPFQSSNCNAYAERFVREARETLDNFILIGQSHLERVVKQIAEHHNTCRPHQGIETTYRSAINTPTHRHRQRRSNARHSSADC